MSHSTNKHLRRRVSLDCGDKLITKQSHKDECDINTILAQYKRTGIITHISRSTANYADLPSNTDYQQALNTVIAAENAFAQLPSKIRDRYHNDPAGLLSALRDPNNRAELTALGILKAPPAPPSPAKAPPAPASPAKAPSAPTSPAEPKGEA